MKSNAKCISRLTRPSFFSFDSILESFTGTNIEPEHRVDKLAEEDIDLVDAKDHKRAVVLAAAVDLEGTARPFVDRSPVLLAGSRSLETLRCQLRFELEVGG